MGFRLAPDDRVGLARSSLDAHTLGLATVAQLLGDCGQPAALVDAETAEAFARPLADASGPALERWIRAQRVTVLGLSYRLDPDDGVALCAALVEALRRRRLLAEAGGPVRALFFAGLPRACARVRREVPEVLAAFAGDETPGETLAALGVEAVPRALAEEITYDEARLAFGRELVRRGDHLALRPPPRSYPGAGSEEDTLVARLRHAAAAGTLPLVRAHVGPYLADRREAVALFLEWARRLAAAGHLDVLSIGTSQLTQSAFGTDWGDRPNGGGVPINSPEEYAAVWAASRPMLVRTYAGSHDVARLARVHEETLHIAWHALSLWWFCQLDGRGPLPVRANLREHLATIGWIAGTGKPFEANVPHHFAFRGADDVTCVVSAVLAARVAKAAGIRHFVLQAMLNTPKATWGLADLAKARAVLALVRRLEDDRFRVILQPRAGLDYLSPDLERARAQLAAATALMDDLEPADPASPPVIHVVSYSEASHLADPAVVDESIQLTRHALAEYRRLRARGLVDDMSAHPEVAARTAELVAEAETVLAAIEATVPSPTSPEGLYQILARGFLPVPYLAACRDELAPATAWRTALVRGSTRVVDETGRPIFAAARMAELTRGATDGRDRGRRE